MFGDINSDRGDFLKKMVNDLKREDSVIMSQLNDNRLLKVAEYEVTQGLTKQKVSPEMLQNTFTEFKKRVKNGDFTIKALEDDVYKRWGVIEDDRTNLTDGGKTPMGFHVDKVDDVL